MLQVLVSSNVLLTSHRFLFTSFCSVMCTALSPNAQSYQDNTHLGHGARFISVLTLLCCTEPAHQASCCCCCGHCCYCQLRTTPKPEAADTTAEASEAKKCCAHNVWVLITMALSGQQWLYKRCDCGRCKRCANSRSARNHKRLVFQQEGCGSDYLSVYLSTTVCSAAAQSFPVVQIANDSVCDSAVGWVHQQLGSLTWPSNSLCTSSSRPGLGSGDGRSAASK